MHLSKIYAEVQRRLDRLVFSALFENFRPFKFALYTDTECFFDGSYIEKSKKFCANTAIMYNAEWIAIWNIQEDVKNYDALTASIVHEMFHAFQIFSGERRYADEMDALFRYCYTAGHLSMKLAEAQLIRRILECGDARTFPALLQLRRARRDAYPYEYEYEAKIEQIEGIASFVELLALTQLDPAAGRSAWQSVLARITQPALYFPIRSICYSTGAALLACIRACSPLDISAFTSVPFSVSMLKSAPAGTVCIPTNAAVAAYLDAYKAETQRIIASAMQAGACVLEGAYPLLSVNLYDARCEGEYVVSNQFLAYLDGEAEAVIYGDFVVQLDARKIVRRVLRQAHS